MLLADPLLLGRQPSFVLDWLDRLVAIQELTPDVRTSSTIGEGTDERRSRVSLKRLRTSLARRGILEGVAIVVAQSAEDVELAVPSVVIRSGWPYDGTRRKPGPAASQGVLVGLSVRGDEQRRAFLKFVADLAPTLGVECGVLHCTRSVLTLQGEQMLMTIRGPEVLAMESRAGRRYSGLGSFMHTLHAQLRGSYWGTLLSPSMVDAVGGEQALLRGLPNAEVRPLGDRMRLLTVTPSPIALDDPGALALLAVNERNLAPLMGPIEPLFRTVLRSDAEAQGFEPLPTDPPPPMPMEIRGRAGEVINPDGSVTAIPAAHAAWRASRPRSLVFWIPDDDDRLRDPTVFAQALSLLTTTFRAEFGDDRRWLVREWSPAPAPAFVPIVTGEEPRTLFESPDAIGIQVESDDPSYRRFDSLRYASARIGRRSPGRDGTLLEVGRIVRGITVALPAFTDEARTRVLTLFDRLRRLLHAPTACVHVVARAHSAESELAAMIDWPACDAQDTVDDVRGFDRAYRGDDPDASGRVLRGAYWGTYLCAELLDAVGGTRALRVALPHAEISAPDDGGAVIFLSSTPRLLTEPGAVESHRALANVCRSILHPRSHL